MNQRTVLTGSAGDCTGLTVCILANPKSTSGRMMGFSLAGSGGEVYISFNAGGSLSADPGKFSASQWAGGGSEGIAGAVDGKTHFFTAIYSARSGGTTIPRVYVDKSVPTFEAAVSESPSPGGVADFVGGYIGGGFGVTDCQQFLTLGFNIEISDATRYALSDNPWQLFAPAQRTSFRPAADGTAASVTATDGADVITANASVSVAISSATTDGADLLAGNASVIVSASSAKTDGADVLTANVTPQAATTSITSATTDGVDVLASSISVIATASSATTDGADTLAATVVPAGTAISSNTTDGADVLAAAVGPQVAAASATTDGADLLAASAGPIVGVSSAAVEGPDTLSSNVAPVQSVAVSAAIADGADVLAANVFTSSPPSGGAPSSDTRKTKRFLVQHEGRTLGFDTRRAAERAIRQLDGPAVLLAQPVVAVAATATRLTAQRVMDAAQEEEDELEMLLLAL